MGRRGPRPEEAACLPTPSLVLCAGKRGSDGAPAPSHTHAGRRARDPLPGLAAVWGPSLQFRAARGHPPSMGASRHVPDPEKAGEEAGSPELGRLMGVCACTCVHLAVVPVIWSLSPAVPEGSSS